MTTKQKISAIICAVSVGLIAVFNVLGLTGAISVTERVVETVNIVLAAIAAGVGVWHVTTDIEVDKG